MRISDIRILSALVALAATLVLAACVAAPVERSAVAVASGQTPRTHAEQTEATRAIAMAFLRQVYVAGDIRGAYDGFATEHMRQHNPLMADGLAGHRAYFAAVEARVGSSVAWANVNNMIIVDGDLFALHHHAFTGPDDPGRAFVDIWRVENGRIVEHWDVIQPIAPTMAHTNGVGCGRGDSYAAAQALGQTVNPPACGFPDRAASRDASLATLDGYSQALFAQDVAGAIERFLTEDYRQHSPVIADGKRGALEFLLEEFGREAAMPRMGPMRTLAEGNLVLMHRLTEYADGSHSANVDIFKVRDGQISEHWDLKQPIPENAANENGMW